MAIYNSTGLFDENGNFLPQDLNRVLKIQASSKLSNYASVLNALSNYYSKLSEDFSHNIGLGLEERSLDIDDFFNNNFSKLSTKLNSSDKKALYVMSRLQDELHLTKAQAAGIAGNLWQESKFNPMAVGDKGKAHGIVQWHPDRRKNINILHASFEDLVTYMINELKGSEKHALSVLRTARTPRDAARIVDRLYERSNGDTLKSRQNLAARYFELLK